VPAAGLGIYGLGQVAAMPGEISGAIGGGGHAAPEGDVVGVTPQVQNPYMVDPQIRRYYEMMQMARQYGYPVY
jgi:hypothetical protein